MTEVANFKALRGRSTAMTRRTFFGRFLSGFVIALPIVMPNARAAPDGPTMLDPPEAVFQGDQRAEIAAGTDFNSPPIYFLLVEDLTAAIEPLSGKPGIDVSHLNPRGSHGSGPYLYQGDHGSPGYSDADTLGQTALSPYSGADRDGSGVIDEADYNVWKANFGNVPQIFTTEAEAATARTFLAIPWSLHRRK
jgi:hypothetical protein